MRMKESSTQNVQRYVLGKIRLSFDTILARNLEMGLRCEPAARCGVASRTEERAGPLINKWKSREIRKETRRDSADGKIPLEGM